MKFEDDVSIRCALSTATGIQGLGMSNGALARIGNATAIVRLFSHGLLFTA